MNVFKNYILDAKIVINSSIRASCFDFSLNLALHCLDLYFEYVGSELLILFKIAFSHLFNGRMLWIYFDGETFTNTTPW